jgi:hypothetical protein
MSQALTDWESSRQGCDRARVEVSVDKALPKRERPRRTPLCRRSSRKLLLPPPSRHGWLLGQLPSVLHQIQIPETAVHGLHGRRGVGGTIVLSQDVKRGLSE